MLPFFNKDFLVYWRDRKEMAISLFMPIIIIIVMGFALPNWVENPSSISHMNVAVVIEDYEETGLAQFVKSLDDRRLPPEEAAVLAGKAKQLLPIGELMQMLRSEKIGEFISIVETDRATALRQLEEGEVSAILMFPEGYTLAALNKLMLSEGAGAALTLTAEELSLEVGIVRNVTDGLLQTYNLQAALVRAADGAAALRQKDSAAPIGGREEIAGFRVVTSFQYYTLSISILFALFIAMTTALKSTTEKRERVFHRIMLTGSHPIRYLSGKVGSTLCLTLLQMTFVFVACHFILDLFPARGAQFWLGLALIAIVYSICVASLSAVFTACAFRLEETTTNGVLMIIIMVAGTIGGSFVPRFVLPQWLQQAGEWTPNGRSLSVFIQWLQQRSLEAVMEPLLQLAAFSIAAMIAGILLFPRRGRI